MDQRHIDEVILELIDREIERLSKERLAIASEEDGLLRRRNYLAFHFSSQQDPQAPT